MAGLRSASKATPVPFTVLPVSLALAAACALINLWLHLRIGQVRRRERIWIGDGGSELLVRRMRAQANFLENAPFVLVLVALIELATAQHGWLWGVAALFVAARLAHPFGMDGRLPARMVGAAATMLVLLVLAVWAIAIPISAQDHLGRGQPVEVTVPRG